MRTAAKLVNLALLGLNIIILKFLLSNVLEINLETTDFLQTFLKFNVKFPKNFLNSSLIFFFEIS